MQTREDVLIPLGAIPAYEAAATLFGVIAFPLRLEDRDKFANSICYKCLNELSKEPDFGSKPRLIRPVHAFQPEDQASRIFEKGHKIINGKRLLAAKMASPSVAAAMRLPDAVAYPPTGEHVMKYLAVDLDERSKTDGGGNSGNVRSRIWTDSRPVLHLCLALHRIIHHAGKDNKYLNIGDFLLDRIIIKDLIVTGAEMLKIVQDTFDIAPEEQIAVVLT